MSDHPESGKLAQVEVRIVVRDWASSRYGRLRRPRARRGSSTNTGFIFASLRGARTCGSSGSRSGAGAPTGCADPREAHPAGCGPGHRRGCAGACGAHRWSDPAPGEGRRTLAPAGGKTAIASATSVRTTRHRPAGSPARHGDARGARAMGCEAATTLRPRCDPRIRARRLMPGPDPSRRFGPSRRSIAQNRALILNAMPCSGADPGSLAGSVRVASSPSASRQPSR